MRKSTLLLVFLSTLYGYAQDGVLDPTFGDGGKVSTKLSNYTNYEGWRIAVQKDKKIIVSGYFSNDNNKDFVTLRYNTDGGLDSTYCNDGIAITDLSSSDYTSSIAFQDDGKIVVAGHIYNGSDTDIAVLRYSADGILDSTFNDSGIVITPIGGSDRANTISIQEDGKIIVAGSTYNGSDYDFAVVRYNSDGSLDYTFNIAGIVITPISNGGNDYVISMSIQEDGKIFVVGTTHSGSDLAVSVARYSTDGSLDNTYNNNGIVTTPIDSGSIHVVNSLVIHNDGGIVVAGRSGSDPEYKYIMEKYNENCILDSTFNKTGKIVISNCFNCDQISYDGAVVVQSDGKIIFGGTSANFDFMLIRYNTNGKIDSSFGDNGMILTDFNNDFDILFGLNAYDDKIIATGISMYPITIPIARYNVVITTTSLKTDTPVGSQTLEVSSTIGFFIGDNIVINPGGANEETNTITGFGSFLLQTPLKFNHLAGELIVKHDPTSVNENYAGIPNDFTLLQNYPNPFNPSTKIEFSLPKAEFVTLKIYNILGEEVATLVQDKLQAGNHTYQFDGGDLASGVYVYRIEAGGFQDVKKMLLIK